jgi:dienelactone hydrolase
VYYPTSSGTFPIVSFGHGYNNGGDDAYACYEQMNSELAAAGYVVIVSESSLWPLECADIWKDQLRSIEWAKASNISSKIDFSKVGLMGHSMGGGASYHNAGQADVVKAYSIGAVVALHPQTSLYSTTNSLVPIFFGTGSKDSVISPSSVKAAYSKTVGVAKAFSEIAGAVHDEPMCDCGTWKSPGHMRHTPFAIAMFDCHLRGDEQQCDRVYGNGSGSLCSGSVKMTDCEHANEPTLGLVTV